MAIVLESASSDVASDSSDTLLEPSVPSGLQTGDRLYAFAACNSNRTLTPPNDWELEDSATEASANLYVFSKAADSDDVSASNLPFTGNGGFGGYAVIVCRVSGASSASVVSSFAAGPNSQSQTCPSIAAPVAGCLVFWGIFRAGGMSGASSNKGSTVAVNGSIGLFASVEGASGSITGATITTGAFSAKALVSFLVQPAAGGGGLSIPVVMHHRRMMGMS